MCAAISLVIYRIALMAIMPLAESTEARYGEIARLTVSNGFWLMPHIDQHTPFFAKPPLSTWLSAIAMNLLGVNEFAARLPALLSSIIALWFANQFARELQIRKRWLLIPVLASCPLFLVSAGAVMTDAVQLACVSAALYFAWRILNQDETESVTRKWHIAFGIAIGLCTLCKGLASIALVGLPLFAYGILQRNLVQTLRKLFDWSGVGVALCIFVPWYAAAEYYYPGFLNYFLIGEHFSRYFVPGWSGDRYGFAHKQHRGSIWVFWIASILPWTGVFVTQLARALFGKQNRLLPAERFLWCATLAPLVFFTFSSNIIWTYGLTAVLPFSVLATRWLENSRPAMRFQATAGVVAMTAILLLCTPLIMKNANDNSDRALINAFAHETKPGTRLIFGTKPTYSSNFYTRGNLDYEPDAAHTQHGYRQYVVIDSADIRNQSIVPDHILYQGIYKSLIEL